MRIGYRYYDYYHCYIQTLSFLLAFVSHTLINKSPYRINNYLCLVEYLPLYVHVNTHFNTRVP